MRGERFRWLAAACAHHLLPKCDAFARVVAGACGHHQAQAVGFGFVVAAVLQREQLAAQLRTDITELAQAEERRAQAQCAVGDSVLAHLLACVFQERVRGFVAHDHGDFVVVELQLGQDAEIERDLAAGHAKGIDAAAADEVDFPLPIARALVALGCEGDDALRDETQAQQLRVFTRRQRVLASCLRQHLTVLLARALLHLFGRDGLGEVGAFAFGDAGRSRQRRTQAAGQHEAAEEAP